MVTSQAWARQTDALTHPMGRVGVVRAFQLLPTHRTPGADITPAIWQSTNPAVRKSLRRAGEMGSPP
jgi:hypothetical protein